MTPTPLRPFRIPDRIYIPARDKAHEEGTTVSAVVRDALEEYVQGESSIAPTS